MFKSDLSKVRLTRQFKTNNALADAIAHSSVIDDKDLKKLINFNSLDRLAELLDNDREYIYCLLYTSPSPRDGLLSRMPSSA